MLELFTITVEIPLPCVIALILLFGAHAHVKVWCKKIKKFTKLLKEANDQKEKDSESTDT